MQSCLQTYNQYLLSKRRKDNVRRLKREVEVLRLLDQGLSAPGEVNFKDMTCQSDCLMEDRLRRQYDSIQIDDQLVPPALLS